MSHLTRKQRYTISAMLQQGYSRTSIAKAIGKDKSVVSRELRRNEATAGTYSVTSGSTNDAAVRLLLPLKEHIRTITSDNGKEFAEHKNIAEKLGVDFFFAHPYHSWERGANENTNGLIRQYIPKGSSFENLTDDYI